MRIETKAKLDYLQETKSLIKNALNEKGIAISDSDTFRSYADSIRNTEFQSPDVRYVTFMNGDATIYVKPVATGDDCVDVKAKGLISTPTKESTVDKVFTYAGWAATDGGAANANVLKAVTENKSVYAAYTEAVRYYTITYYDSDGTTVLKTESLAYGSTPSYAPTKDGYGFDGWSPAIEAVTGNASYTANWKQLLTLNDYTWAQLEAMTLEEAQEKFTIGDVKKTTIYYASGFKLSSVNMVLVGFAADTLENGNRAKMTFIGQIGSGSWIWGGSVAYPSCKFVTEKLSNFDTWNNADNADLVAVVKSVKKTYLNSTTDETLSTINAKWWLASLVELGYTHDSAAEEGSKYPLFADGNNFSDFDKILKYGNFATRSKVVGDGSKYFTLNKTVVTQTATNNTSVYPIIGFCI